MKLDMTKEAVQSLYLQQRRESRITGRRSTIIVYCLDVLTIQLAVLLGFIIQYGGVAQAPEPYVENWERFALEYELIIFALLNVLQPRGCNWRHAGMRDLGSAAVASVIAEGIGILLSLALCYRLPSSVYAFALLFQLALTTITRSVCMVWANVDPPAERLYIFFKRIFDVTTSSCALIALSPIFLAIAVAIKLDDGGPVIYTSIRVGQRGRQFRFYKFRSMYTDADKHLNEVMFLNEMNGPVFKVKNDPRITRVGRFLRRTSLDELPQLINIICGDMSVVGPRPPLPREVLEYSDYELQRLTIPGGLTCYWQCNGRSEIGFDDWMRMDMQYIKDRGIWTDMELILKTLSAVLSGKGAE